MTREEEAALNVYMMAGGFPLRISLEARARDTLQALLASGFRYVGPDEVVVPRVAVDLLREWKNLPTAPDMHGCDWKCEFCDCGRVQWDLEHTDLWGRTSAMIEANEKEKK